MYLIWHLWQGGNYTDQSHCSHTERQQFTMTNLQPLNIYFLYLGSIG